MRVLDRAREESDFSRAGCWSVNYKSLIRKPTLSAPSKCLFHPIPFLSLNYSDSEKQKVERSRIAQAELSARCIGCESWYDSSRTRARCTDSIIHVACNDYRVFAVFVRKPDTTFLFMKMLGKNAKKEFLQRQSDQSSGDG